MHADQLAVPLATVRALVDTQFPQWRDLPVTAVASEGTVNAIFRVGDRLAARFGLRPLDVSAAWRQVASEADAARELVGRTRFRTPEPVALGEPGLGYPLPWSVQTWLPGVTATDADPSGSVAFARDLAEFIRGVRAIDVRGRVFSGGGRGGVLMDRGGLASAGRRATAGAARGTGVRRSGVGARPGVGFSAGDGTGLVLRRQQSVDESAGPPDAGPYRRRLPVTAAGVGTTSRAHTGTVQCDCDASSRAWLSTSWPRTMRNSATNGLIGWSPNAAALSTAEICPASWSRSWPSSASFVSNAE